MRYKRDFTIAEADLQKFYRMLVLRRWSKGVLGFGVVGALVGKLYMGWLNIPLTGAWEIIALVLAGLVTMLFVTLGVVFRTRQNVRKTIRSRGRGNYVQQTEIDGFGVHVTVNGEKAKVGFEKLHMVEETKDAFYLFLTAGDAWILPKEQMEEPERESEAIRAIFSKVIEPKRRRLMK